MDAYPADRRLLRRLPLLATLLGACLLARAVPTAGAAQAVAGPDLTVVGFGLADETPQPAPPLSSPQSGALQVNVNLQVISTRATTALQRLAADLRAAEADARAAGVPESAIVQQGPQNLNFDSSQQAYRADATLVLNLKTLAGGARMLDRLNLPKLPDVSNVWVNFPTAVGTTLAPTPRSMAAAYAAAFADAARAARLMAAADGLTLGRQVSVAEGAPAMGQCGMGGCNPALVPGLMQVPWPGPNQTVVAVTVTYATTEAAPAP